MGDAPTLSMFIEAWELFREPALAGVLAGALLGFMGIYVVLRRMVFMSAALSQAAGFGVTLAFYASLHLGVTGALVDPTLVSTVVTLGAALLLAVDTSALGVRRDSFLGFAYLVGASGALAVGTRIVQEVHDVHTILFGSAVAVLPEDFRLLVVTVALLFALQLWWLRGFVQASFDRDGAAVRGLPVRLLEMLLLGSIAIGISVATRVLGALPVFAFSVLPAMAALRLSVNVHRGFVLAAVLGACAGFLGYLLAFLYELPVGAAQALVAAMMVVVAELLRRARVRI